MYQKNMDLHVDFDVLLIAKFHSLKTAKQLKGKVVIQMIWWLTKQLGILMCAPLV